MFSEYITEIKASLDRLPVHQVQHVVDTIISAWQRNQQIFIIGNGGSASTASHMACDLSKNTANVDAPRLRVMSLNDNMALFSAYSNDNGYENVFAEQLKNFVNRGDILVAISASGNSKNILKAIRLANSMGAITIGWSGYDGGELAQIAQIPLVVPSHNIERIEDIHLMLEHMVTVAVRDAMATSQLEAPMIMPLAEVLELSPFLQ